MSLSPTSYLFSSSISIFSFPIVYMSQLIPPALHSRCLSFPPDPPAFWTQNAGGSPSALLLAACPSLSSELQRSWMFRGGLPAPRPCPKIFSLLHSRDKERSMGKSLWVSKNSFHPWGSLEFPSTVFTAHSSSRPSAKNERGCEAFLWRAHHLFLRFLFEGGFTLYSSNISSRLEVESSFDKNTFYLK